MREKSKMRAKKEKIRNEEHNKAPYNCPHYFNNWNSDDCCKKMDGDYCGYDEFTGCPDYNEIFGKPYIKKKRIYCPVQQDYVLSCDDCNTKAECDKNRETPVSGKNNNMEMI
jgi:hypothetical protein